MQKSISKLGINFHLLYFVLVKSMRCVGVDTIISSSSIVESMFQSGPLWRSKIWDISWYSQFLTIWFCSLFCGSSIRSLNACLIRRNVSIWAFYTANLKKKNVSGMSTIYRQYFHKDMKCYSWKKNIKFSDSLHRQRNIIGPLLSNLTLDKCYKRGKNRFVFLNMTRLWFCIFFNSWLHHVLSLDKTELCSVECYIVKRSKNWWFLAYKLPLGDDNKFARTVMSSTFIEFYQINGSSGVTYNFSVHASAPLLSELF